MYTYLLVDLGAILIPFIFSFHHRLKFHKYFHLFFFACFLVGVPFIIWDIIFTHEGIWGFNSRYLTGFEFFGLPLEEYLFFICIPFACVFSYYTLGVLKPIKNSTYVKYINIFLSLALLVVSILFHEKLYTSVTFSLISLVLLLLRKWHKMTHFFVAFVILMLPFFIVNGILTGTGLEQEVVWYNNDFNLNIRLFTIPIEDIFYAMLMLLPTIFIFEKLVASRRV